MEQATWKRQRGRAATGFCAIVLAFMLTACMNGHRPASGEQTSRAAAGESPTSEAPRHRESLDQNWRFTRGDAPDAAGRLAYAKIRPWVIATGNQFVADDSARPARPAGDPGDGISYLQSGFDDSAWQRVNLPHDWAIAGPFDLNEPGDTGKLPFTGVGWYRRHFAVGAGDAGRRVYLDVDGAMSYAAVWLNGQFVGGWPYGYSSFELDLTPYVHRGGDNVLAIRLENPPRSSRWYPGAGLYRNLWLVTTDPVHVQHWGTRVTTPMISEAAATVDIRSTIANDSPTDATVTVRTQVCDPRLNITAQTAAEQTTQLHVAPGQSAEAHASLTLKNPVLWQASTANDLYYVRTTVERDGKVIDRCITQFGVRALVFDPHNGFMLNGKPLHIQGVCDHGDLGALGIAVNTRALQRQLQMLQAMGCNAIRTSHNPPPPELLQLCDEMGMLVMDECFDCWEKGKNPNDYHMLWNDWHEKDWRAQLRRDRNHPCVVMWSIGNEVPDFGSKAGPSIARSLTAMAHEEDGTRPTTFACNWPQDHVTPGFVGSVDVWGVNYQPQNYAGDQQRHPDLPLFGSETASTVSSRGVYVFPVSDDRKLGRQDFQVSSYDTSTPPWATTPDTEWKYMDQTPSVFGEFVWTGFDYLGEPTPFSGDVTNALNFTDPAERAMAEAELKKLGKVRMPSRSSYFGIIDLAGFPKDRFYLYQSRWRADLPMVHILPHWNWPDRIGQVTPVFVYTSGDEAELFLNGHSLGRKKKQPLEYRLRWDDVKYEPGELKAVAYRDGKRWATDTVKTTGAATKLVLSPDRRTIAADGRDLSFVTLSVSDASGMAVPTANNRITFSVDGPGELVATDNGDATDLDAFPSPQRKAFNGLALAIVRSNPGHGGTITVHATADGLQSAQVKIEAERP